MAASVPTRTIGRLSLYRRLLGNLIADGVEHVYSHQLATMGGVTAAQVRRDMMSVGYSGSPKRGYEVTALAGSIGNFLDASHSEPVALVGVGNLGRAIMAYFAGRRPRLTITAAFDSDPYKLNRVILGCRCHALSEAGAVIGQLGIMTAIVTVPASAAQDVADQLVRAGIRGILNFAPIRLRVRPGVYVEDIDMTMSLEKVAYFARQNAETRSIPEAAVI
jgi:redox-sensing transcriptional repressor